MKSTRPSDLFPEFTVPEIDSEYAKSYPFEGIALAVARLRGRLGLTQAQFASRVGTTQSVIARLESGRHGIQISFVNRIADAFGIDWQLVFGDSDAEPAGDEAGVTARHLLASGDALLDSFNEANTSGDLVEAHRIALRIQRNPSSARRCLALAIDAFNGRRFGSALKRSGLAMRMGLPESSAAAARLVAGRSLLALKRPSETLEILAGEDDGFAGATRAEAMIELGEIDGAIEVAERLLAVAEGAARPAAWFLAARVYWHANRPLEALSHISSFRNQDPADSVGALLHAAILGYIGDRDQSNEAYRLAMAIILEVPADDPEVLRLRAMTAARLGDWRGALESVRLGLELGSVGRGMAKEAAATVVTDCLDRLDNATDLELAAAFASEHNLVEERVVRSRRAFACALRGDFDGAVSALGLTVGTLAEADPDDQIRCASALLVDNQIARAFPILQRNQSVLSVPDGQLFLARAALGQRDIATAREALARVAESDGPAAETARVAIDLLRAIKKGETESVLQRLSLTPEDSGRPNVLSVPFGLPAPDSPWEGPASHGNEPTHASGFPVLDRMMRRHVTTEFVH